MNSNSYTINAAQYATLQDSLATASASLNATYTDPVARNAGTITDSGVQLGFTWDGTSQLKFWIISKPFFVPATMVWNELDKYVP